MIYNPFKRLLGILPNHPLQIGTVTAYADGIATIVLSGGGVLKARGEAAVSDPVFVRGGVIEGPAPALTVVLIEVGA